MCKEGFRMIDPGIFAALLNTFIVWYQSVRNQSARFNEAEKDAVMAFYTAVNETRIYLKKIGRPDPSKDNELYQGSLDEQERLSRLWNHASVKIFPFSAELADRCLIKSEYWTDPESWSKDEIEKQGIGIDTMFQHAQELIGQ